MEGRKLAAASAGQESHTSPSREGELIAARMGTWMAGDGSC